MSHAEKPCATKKRNKENEEDSSFQPAIDDFLMLHASAAKPPCG